MERVSQPTGKPTVSVVIPTYCERETIADCVANAAAIGDEVVVADGGSPDRTAELALAAGARVVESPKGRGEQLRAGAAHATCDVLLFLHADARLSPDARPAIQRALRDPHVVGGNFLLRFAPEGGWSRFFGTANDLRRRWLGIYYGDSGLFVRRDVYEALGGFATMPLMEDYEFVRRLERVGRTAYLRDVPIHASARRFEHAPLRTLAGWGIIQLLYSLGTPSNELARLYADIR